jgi:F-type H+-transporting ATPase subunit alpha
MNIPKDICDRFETAEKLSDEDRKSIIEIARKVLIDFQPKLEAKPEDKVESQTKPEPKPKLEIKTAAKESPKTPLKEKS